MSTKIMKTLEGVTNTLHQHTTSLQALEAKAETVARPRLQGTLQSLEELEELNNRLKIRSCFNNLVCVQCVFCSLYGMEFNIKN